jgi:plasmid stabilization system protein ParE
MERWIQQEAGPATARRYREAMIHYCAQLERFPKRGRARDDLREGLRTIIFRRRVTIGYVVADGSVQIIAIIGKGRDIRAALDDPDENSG